MTRPLAYITASFGDEDLDVKSVAAKYCRIVYEAGYSPICPALWQPYILKKNKAVELRDGRDMANELLRRSRILVVCGEADTEEMLEDIALAKRLRIAATTLEGIITIENKAASNKPKKR